LQLIAAEVTLLEPTTALVLVAFPEMVPLVMVDVLLVVELLLVLFKAWTHPIGEIMGPGLGSLFPISTIMTGHVLCIAIVKTAERLVESKDSVMPMKGLDDSRVEDVMAA
jgi:hypothetical protein